MIEEGIIDKDEIMNLYIYDNIKFFATPTPFRHLGFFPDQSPHWLWASKKIPHVRI